MLIFKFKITLIFEHRLNYIKKYFKSISADTKMILSNINIIQKSVFMKIILFILILYFQKYICREIDKNVLFMHY